MRKSRILSLVLMMALVLTPVVSLARVGRSYAQECSFDPANDNNVDDEGDNLTDCASNNSGEYVGAAGDDVINFGVTGGAVVVNTAANSVIAGDGYQGVGAPYATTDSGNDIITVAAGSTVTCTTVGGLVGDSFASAAAQPPALDPSGADTFNIEGTVTCNIYGDNFDIPGNTAYVGTNAGGSNDTINVGGTYTGTAYGQGGDDQFTLNLGTYSSGSWSGGATLGTSTFDGGTNTATGDRVTLTISTDDDSFYTHLVNNCGASASGGAGADMGSACTITVGGQSYVLAGFERFQANVTYTGAVNPIDEDGDGVINSADLCLGTPPATAVDATGCPVSGTPVTPPTTPTAPTGGGGDSGGGGGTFTVVLVLVPVAPAKVGNAFVGGGILALGNIRIRQTPDLGGVVLGQIPWGTIVTVLKDNPSKEWVFIRYGAIEGWVSANWFVLPNGDTLYSPEELGLGFIIPANGARAVGNVRMRSQPNLGAAVVGQVPWGRIVTILDEDPTGLWWLISFRGKQAWVSNEWFEIPDGSIYTPYGGFFTPGDIPVEEYVLDLSDVHAASGTAVALAPVRLRFAPTLAAPRMGLVDWGDVVVIRGVDSTGNWWLVDYDGTSGWVANEWFVRQ